MDDLEYKCNAALHRAIDDSNELAVELLTRVGTDVNNRLRTNCPTPLIRAAKKGNLTIMRALLDANTNVNETDKDKYTALVHAIEKSNREVVKLLIENGADVNVSCKYEGIYIRTPLMFAVMKGNIEIIKALLQANVNVNASFKHGYTALIHAIVNTNEEVVKLLIEKGADVNVSCKYDGRTPLMYAVRKGNIDIARILVNGSAKVNAFDKSGKTALHFAASTGTPIQRDMIPLLIKAGANIHARDSKQETALFDAVRECNTKAIEALVGADADVNARNIYGRTPLLYSISWHCINHKNCNVLLENGARWNLKDNCGFSVLSYFISILCRCNDDAQKYYYFEINHHKNDDLLDFIKKIEQTDKIFTSVVNLLYSNLPKFNIRRGFMVNGIKLAREFASDEHQKEIVKKLANLFNYFAVGRIPEMLDLLIQLNADPESVDSYGNTALHSVVHLPCFGISEELTMTIIRTLEKNGARLDTRNHNGHSPLMHWLSEWEKGYDQGKLNDFNVMNTICKHLLSRGPFINQTGRNGESVFHLLLNLFHKILNHLNVEKINLKSMAKLFKKIVRQLATTQKFTVNKIDKSLSSPLHLWASLPWKENILGDLTFHCFMKKIFDHLFTCGIHLNARDKDDKTPLHCCKTWSAVKCLVEAGAIRNDFDSNGRNPLLAAAHDKVFEIRERCFFPDNSDETKSFFEECIKMGLDLWDHDNYGESILTLLLASGSFELANGLVEAACDFEPSILSRVLFTICKDRATHTFWKSTLVDKVLSCVKRPQMLDLNSALKGCCTAIKALYETRKLKFDNGDSGSSSSVSVHLDIVYKLRLEGANSECCKDLCADIKELETFLTRIIDPNEARLQIPWTSYSQKHNAKLQRVARGQNIVIIDTYWCHEEPIDSGSFGDVYAGICEKDGREIAIKKIQKRTMSRPQEKREIDALITLADCNQVVKYICFYDDDVDFVYIVLELMEGNLDDYLTSRFFDPGQSLSLCRDLIMGLEYLHEHAILHRDLKPGNILYKVHPHLCLKIADFGLSSPLSTTGTTVLGTNAGTRSWIAPEVISSSNYQHTQESDNYSCGLLLHYVLSKQKHPFSPAHCSNSEMSELNTRTNMINDNMEGLDSTLCPEAKHLVKGLLSLQANERPSAADALSHPLFWTNKKKLDFLSAVGNQPEIERPLPACGPLPPVESDMETLFKTIVKYPTWNDARYLHMPAIYAEMTKPIVRGRAPPRPARTYNIKSVVELIRFVRNAISHVSEASRPPAIKQQILKDAVFLEYFPDLVMEVYKIVIKHGWDTREEINHKM